MHECIKALLEDVSDSTSLRSFSFSCGRMIICLSRGSAAFNLVLLHLEAVSAGCNL